MFYLYHIKGKKWGCTKNLNQRLKRQGYSISDCANIITVGNIDLAEKMERELNVEYGYKNQSYSYINALKNAPKGGNKTASLGKMSKIGKKRGPIQGKLNVTNGLLKQIRDEQNYSKIECPHCKFVGQARAMKRWHYDNCKHKIVK